jgi:hypothetical protein
MNLLKKIAAPLAPFVLPIVLAFASPQPAQAQKFYIEASGGVFSSFDKHFQDYFGAIPTLDVGLGLKGRNDISEIALKIGAPQMSDTYNSVTMTETFTIGELDLRYMRFFGNEDDIRPFAGLQGSLNFIRDSTDKTYNGQKTNVYDSGLLVGVGGGVFAGVDFPIIDNKTTLYGEAGVNFATVPLPSGSSFNDSGLFAKIGVRRFF